MPYTIRRRKRCFQVINRKSRRIYSKCTTKSKAQKQMRLLRAIEYNPRFASSVRARRLAQNVLTN